MNKYLKFEYWNTCDLGNIYYQGGQHFIFYLDADVGEPIHEEVEEGQENGDGDFIATYRRQMKRYRIRTGLISDYLIDAIQRMKLHDHIELTFKSGEVEQIYNVDCEVEWQFEKYAWQGTVTLTFDIDESITVGACCDNLTVEAEPPGPVDLGGYYLAPTGSDDTGDGSFDNPWFTLEKAWAVIAAGDTVYMRGGTYEYTTRQDLNGKSGSAGNRINIFAYPGEQPIITKDASFNVAVQGQLILIDADYLHLKGLEITGFEQVEGNRAWSPIQCTTTSHSIFELLNVHHNGMGMIIELQSDDNLILNCDFHHNYDVYGRTPYDGSSYAYNDGDGLVVRKMPGGYSNTIRGCRSWNNADDGFDVWGCDGYITFDGCWAWNNGYRENGTTTGGDGGGFKMGETVTLDNSVFARTVQNCVAFNNRQFGITQNGALCKHYIYNNTIFGNLYRGIYFSTTWGDSAHVVTNNIAYNNTTNFMGPPNTVLTTNSWSGFTVADDDFVSVTPTGVDGDRQSDGSLPLIDFLHLATGSDLIYAGTYVALDDDCDGDNWHIPPSLGAYEY